MATPGELARLATLLSDPTNVGRSADELAEEIMKLVESFRARAFKYVTVSQDRRKPLENGRSFHPTWARGPFTTQADAAASASAERRRLPKHPETHTMTVQVFGVEDEVRPDELTEVVK